MSEAPPWSLEAPRVQKLSWQRNTAEGTSEGYGGALEGALKTYEGAFKGDKRRMVSAHLHGGLGAMEVPSEAFKAPWMPFIRGLRAAS